MKMDDRVEEEENSWLQELEAALVTDCDLTILQKICNQKVIPHKLRQTFWQVCLGVKESRTVMEEFFDLPEQNLIRADCQKLVGSLGNDEDDKLSVLSDLESIITTYSKTKHIKYTNDNGWIEILSPLMALNLPKNEIYNCFEKIIENYIPKCFHRKEGDNLINGHPFHLLRLLLLYHDTELCSFLDTKKITPDLYAVSWFRSLFSSHCNIKVIHGLWDVYFQLANPFLIFFLALVMLINAKEQIMEAKDEKRETLIAILNAVPSALDIEDIGDLFYLVEQHYISRTPSTIKDFQSLIFESPSTPQRKELNSLGENLEQILCFPVPVSDLLRCSNNSSVKYFVVDCRPADQYNNGHLSTAFHLDCSLMLQEPTAFNTAVEGLLAVQKQAIDAGSVAGGKHLCFMGSGRDEEDRYVHMVISSFLQKQHQYVSLAFGGYSALHQMIMSKVEFEKYLVDHNKKYCISCKQPQNSLPLGSYPYSSHSPFGGSTSGSDVDEHFNSTSSIFDKVATVVKSKSLEMKGKLVDYITNPNQAATEGRHVSSKDKLGKRYKGSKFSIGEDEDPANISSGDEERSQEIDIEAWSKNQNILASFKCSEFKDDSYKYPSYLALSKTHLFVLREIPHNKGFAKIIAKRPLEMIVQITSKRRCPELITFKYGQTPEGMDSKPTIIAIDHFIIQKPYDVTRLVKQQVIRVLDGNPDGIQGEKLPSN